MVPDPLLPFHKSFPFWFSPLQEKTNKIWTWVVLNVLLFLLWWHVHFQCAPMQNFNRDLPEIGKISPRLARSQGIAEISSWCLGLLQTLASAARLSTSCRDWWDLTEIAEISPRLQQSCHDLCGLTRSWQDFPTSQKYCLNIPILFVSFTKECALFEPAHA